jgi:uncharacterized protein (DUF4415 family)
MSKDTTLNTSGTDWDRLKSMPDDDIAADDVPYDSRDEQAVNDFWQNAVVTSESAKTAARAVKEKKRRGSQKNPKKIPVSIRLPESVVEFFKAEGNGWQTRLSDALEEYVEKHR